MPVVPDVRIGIVAFETPSDLDGCLRTLPAAVEGLNAEVVVVDNGSRGDADAEVARRHDVRLLRNARNVGYARAMNQALQGTTAPVLLALNPDTLLTPGSLTRLVRALLADHTIGLLGPRMTGQDGELQHSVRSFPSPGSALLTGLVPPALRPRLARTRLWLQEAAEPSGAVDVDWLVGAVHVVRRRAVRREQVYSERSFMYAEDMELCWHVRRGGWRVVYDPTVSVQHSGNTSGAKAFGAAREQRWLDATYDWYVHTHGSAAARRWAAANAVGLAAKRSVLAVGGAAEHRAFVSGLLGFHARRVLRPTGDLHSRLDADGGEPEAPRVVHDSADGGTAAGQRPD
jgi:N-acetylglucosaminyl-diphospho-decaprenol L-rhamnosyltransferase